MAPGGWFHAQPACGVSGAGPPEFQFHVQPDAMTAANKHMAAAASIAFMTGL